MLEDGLKYLLMYPLGIAIESSRRQAVGDSWEVTSAGQKRPSIHELDVLRRRLGLPEVCLYPIDHAHTASSLPLPLLQSHALAYTLKSGQVSHFRSCC